MAPQRAGAFVRRLGYDVPRMSDTAHDQLYHIETDHDTTMTAMRLANEIAECVRRMADAAAALVIGGVVVRV